MYELKRLPWWPLLGIASLTIAVATLLDGLLTSEAAVQQAEPLYRILFSPTWFLLTRALVSAGIGALAVFLLERLTPQIRIYASVLWALIGCLIVVLALRSLLPLPGTLTSDPNTISFVGLLLGVFMKGRRYW